jgi:hypothetical protein
MILLSLHPSYSSILKILSLFLRHRAFFDQQSVSHLPSADAAKALAAVSVETFEAMQDALKA